MRASQHTVTRWGSGRQLLVGEHMLPNMFIYQNSQIYSLTLKRIQFIKNFKKVQKITIF